MTDSAVTRRRAIASRSSVVYQEIGEGLVKNSLSTITEFNKFLIGTCFGAIPVFLGLLKLTIPGNASLAGTQLILSVSVVGVFLFGSLLAIFGYMPMSDRIGLQEPDSVKQSVKAAVTFRRCMAISSMILLMAGVVGVCIAVLVPLS